MTRELKVPELSLVVLCGTSGSGKSTFAAKHFGPFETLSSDHYRGVVSNDVTSQRATNDAFEALKFIAETRLKRGLLTVIDATNVRQADRQGWVQLARKYHVLPVVIHLDTPTAVSVERNKSREDRQFGARVVKVQHRELKRNASKLKYEGFRYVHRVQHDEEVTVVRPKPWTDRREESGPFDIIGDVHGCFDELVMLIEKLGWSLSDNEGVFSAVHPEEERRLILLGDLIDRGPASHEVLRLAMDLADQGVLICIPGNHEAKLIRWLQGKNPNMKHGFDKTVEQLEGCSREFYDRCLTFLDSLVSHFVLDGGKLCVAHAGMRSDLMGRASGKVRSFALFGETTGETDAFGHMVRFDWAADYEGNATVVYGHLAVPYADWRNNTICIDTGCVFGGELTALRWPSRELVSVKAKEVYYEPAKPLEVEQKPDDGLLHIGDVLGKQHIDTQFRMGVTIQPQFSAAALEVLSRFAVDPRWLIHLPPTMSPTATSKREGFLEHPDEAFEAYKQWGCRHVVLEEKHMGSRAMVLVARSAEALEKRFRNRNGESCGLVMSRRGRRFFRDSELERQLLERVRDAAEKAGLFDELRTEWLLLDCELMPWSQKARELLLSQYAPVGAAATHALGVAGELLAAAGGNEELAGRVQSRLSNAESYRKSYRQYCWKVDGIDDVKLAPFHLLASEGRVHHNMSNPWHMTMMERLAEHDDVVMATRWREVDLEDAEAVAGAVDWWTEHTDAGGEGLVVKPREFLRRHKGKVVQPALKVRGREYLRIIYGPDYTEPEHLERLRNRATQRKRSLALREFVLGLEALERFVAHKPLRSVHQAVFGILALESEPIDPRL